MTLNEQS